MNKELLLEDSLVLLNKLLVDDSFKKKLEVYYKTGIEQTLVRANKNAFHNGVPFIWCSNNLVVDLILQILLYEKMTGDQQYHAYALALRDWLLCTQYHRRQC